MHVVLLCGRIPGEGYVVDHVIRKNYTAFVIIVFIGMRIGDVVSLVCMC